MITETSSCTGNFDCSISVYLLIFSQNFIWLKKKFGKGFDFIRFCVFWFWFWSVFLIYRGDTPFCSEDCRQEQIEIDEAKEKSWNLSASMRALRKKEQRKSTASNSNSKDCPIRTSTVAAAWNYCSNRPRKKENSATSLLIIESNSLMIIYYF